MQTDPEIKHPDNTRRGFLKRLIGFIAVLNGLVLGIPLAKYLLGPSPTAGKKEWLRITQLDSLPEGRPTEIRFQAISNEAYLHTLEIRSLWAIKKASGDVTVFSPICTHLGCHYHWNTRTNHFECPCHASVFDVSGKVLSGPAPRPLDTLPVKTEDGALFVQWERFRIGTREKINVSEV